VLARGDLREKVREGREGNLVLFVVDASGSMAARRRMVAVKGAVLSLLLDAYQRRDRIGLVTFRGTGADVAVPPTASVELAARLLDGLPTGGRTPLAAGLECAAEVLAAERVREPDRRPLLILVTDGRATGPGGPARAEAAASGLAARKVPGVVVDTEEGAVRLGLAGRVAAALGVPWLRLEELAADGLARVVRGFRGGGGRAA
jgi:magnesium chelatase subunit D